MPHHFLILAPIRDSGNQYTTAQPERPGFQKPIAGTKEEVVEKKSDSITIVSYCWFRGLLKLFQANTSIYYTLSSFWFCIDYVLAAMLGFHHFSS